MKLDLMQLVANLKFPAIVTFKIRSNASTYL